MLEVGEIRFRNSVSAPYLLFDEFGEEIRESEFGAHIRPEWLFQFTGFHDKNKKEVYFGDRFVDGLLSSPRPVDDVTVAHWIVDSDKMNSPMRSVEIVGNAFQDYAAP